MQKLVVVTGGAGFVGSHLCERLVRDGHRVISLDNYFTGSRDNHVEGVEYRDGHSRDITRHIPERPDLVYHLGEYSRVEKSFEDPIDLVWDLNIAGTFAVLEFCRKHKSKLIYAGSSTKFADDGLGKSQSPYAWSKSGNTELVKNYGTWFGLEYAITYFYNVYGPGERGNGPYATLIGIFSEQYRRGLPLTVVSPGTQTRNFTHIEDIVEGLMLVGEKGNGDEFGIGSPEAFSVLEVADMFGHDKVMLPERRGNRMNAPVEDAKTRSLGWEPKRTLRTFLGETLEEVHKNTKRQSRILVFSTTFHPIEGVAEKALSDVIEALPNVHFDIVTTAHSKEARYSVSPHKNATIHRLGSGKKTDKYLLPLLGYWKAMEIYEKEKYIFAWSLMASYAALAATLFRRATFTPLLVTLANQRLHGIPFVFRLPLRFTLKHADQVSATESHQERAVTRLTPSTRLTASAQGGDAFANQIRFLYNDMLRKRMEQK